MGTLTTKVQLTTKQLAERDAKRIKQIKFILEQRMNADLLEVNRKRLDVIAGRQLVNVLETKKGALYVMPRHISSSDSFETHVLH